MTREDLDRFLKSEEEKHSILGVLNEREFELFSMLSQGSSSHQISQVMGIEVTEVKELKEQIRSKLNLRNEVELIQFSAKHRAKLEKNS